MNVRNIVVALLLAAFMFLIHLVVPGPSPALDIQAPCQIACEAEAGRQLGEAADCPPCPGPKRQKKNAAAAAQTLTLEETVPLMQQLTQKEVGRQPPDKSPAAQAALPLYPRRTLSTRECQTQEHNWGKLKAHLTAHGWTATPEEISAFNSRDGCYVGCQLIVDGFPVSEENSWADSSNANLAMSMHPHTLQIASIGLLQTCFVRMP